MRLSRIVGGCDQVGKPPLPPNSKGRKGAKGRHMEILDSVLPPGSSDGEALLCKIKERLQRCALKSTSVG